jgi:dihydroflavonol-4-reductase
MGVAFGPTLFKTRTVSLELFTRLLKNKYPGLPNVKLAFVDVRDVARAHLLAIQIPKAANKRIIINNECLWFSEVTHILSDVLTPHSYKIP